ncbi:hypothetical protein ABT404_16105 [Streptomyces hyaluromycini]|uniref:Uncharacterized protein n=1 Tax=Streptomyces hyaluromycini TaxID=1377993 RepID=A0ABV1WW80_9ACTN
MADRRCAGKLSGAAEAGEEQASGDQQTGGWEPTGGQADPGGQGWEAQPRQA